MRSHAGGGPVRVELGPGPVRGTVPGRAEVVLGRGAAQVVERGEEGRSRGPGWGRKNSKCAYQEAFREPGPGAGLLHQVEEGPAQGQEARFPAAEEEVARPGTPSGSPGRCAAPGPVSRCPRLGAGAHARGHRASWPPGWRAGTARITSATVKPDRAALVRLLHRRRRRTRPPPALTPGPAAHPWGSTWGSKRCSPASATRAAWSDRAGAKAAAGRGAVPAAPRLPRAHSRKQPGSARRRRAAAGRLGRLCTPRVGGRACGDHAAQGHHRARGPV